MPITTWMKNACSTRSAVNHGVRPNRRRVRVKHSHTRVRCGSVLEKGFPEGGCSVSSSSSSPVYLGTGSATGATATAGSARRSARTSAASSEVTWSTSMSAGLMVGFTGRPRAISMAGASASTAPLYTIWPLPTNMARSNPFKTGYCGRTSSATTVRSSASFRRSCTTIIPGLQSSPLVGSSSTSRVAGVTMNLASATRAFSPPLRNATRLCIWSPWNWKRPRRALSSLGGFMGAAFSNVPSTVSSGSSASAWFCSK
mmetsp:Transcript_30952/g.67626  ORF Transcript_30952/g.67626 Transcript_30952/m.67626 type:complete len:257 (-) Transcript_30952:606-1376(-)